MVLIPSEINIWTINTMLHKLIVQISTIGIQLILTVSLPDSEDFLLVEKSMTLKFNFPQLIFSFHGFSEMKGPLDSFPICLQCFTVSFARGPVSARTPLGMKNPLQQPFLWQDNLIVKEQRLRQIPPPWEFHHLSLSAAWALKNYIYI